MIETSYEIGGCKEEPKIDVARKSYPPSQHARLKSWRHCEYDKRNLFVVICWKYIP